MARISTADIEYVRDHADIERIIGDTVTLKRAGAALKGLCPFHDERSPSFNVTPSRGIYHCFGCGAGGDVIQFVQETTGQTFVEAVKHLADRMGYSLSIEEDPNADKNRQTRSRLVEANKAAADYYAAQLFTTAGKTAVTFLTDRGFSREHAEDFGCGYAPGGWHATHTFLKDLGFTDDELVAAGLLNKGEKGAYDAFRDRLTFAIRNTTGDVIGFGARRLSDDDQGPKYLNTSETSLYRKSTVLYGMDKARRNIASRREAVIVEGYTDVMACHIAGVNNAVATCGTAFGPDHAKMLHRTMAGESKVIYLFDGDEAGQKAAAKSFTLDAEFSSSTYAVILPDGKDPCELRMTDGDEALAALVASPEPLFGIVLKAEIGDVNFDEPESQRDAVNRAAPVLASIPNLRLREDYIRRTAAWTGLPMAAVQSAISGVNRPQKAYDGAPPMEEPVEDEEGEEGQPVDGLDLPDPHDRFLRQERATLRLVLQNRDLEDLWRGMVEPFDYLHPTHRRLATDLDAEHPVLDTLRRSMLVEERSQRVVGDDEHERTIFLDFAEGAVKRRLARAGELTQGLMSDDQRERVEVERDRQWKRYQAIMLLKAGVEIDT